MNYLFLWWLLVLAVVLISPLRIWIDYRHRGKTEDTLLVQVGLLWGLKSFSVEVPIISSSAQGVAVQAEVGKKKKKIRLSIPSLEQLREHFKLLSSVKKQVKKILNFFFSSVKVKRFIWHTELGIQDSARLAPLVGAMWAVKGSACAALQSWFPFQKRPICRIIPHFNSSYFRTVFTCILEFPVGYAIIASFYVVYMLIKFKLSRRGEINVRTSNSRPDEDSHGEHQRNGGCQYSNR